MKITTNHIINDFLVLNYSYIKLSKIKVERLSRIIQNVVILKTLHEDIFKVESLNHLSYFQGSSLTNKQFKKDLGNGYKAIVDIFFDYTPYNKKLKISRIYKLKDDVIDKLILFIRNTKDLATGWFDRNGRKINKIKHSIQQTDENNKKIKSTITINPLVRVNLKLIDEVINILIEILKNKTSSSKNRERLLNVGINNLTYYKISKEITLKYLWILYSIKRISLKSNSFPQLYRETDNGRITGIGLNLQNLDKQLRRVILSNQNMFDYDMEASSPTILTSIGKKYKINVNVIRKYISNKDSIRGTLSSKYDLAIKDVKEIINSVFYGVGTKLNGYYKYRTSLLKYFNENVEETKKFLNDDLIKELFETRDRVYKVILEKEKYSRGKVLINVLKKNISLVKLNDKGKRVAVENNKLMAHLIFGYEALILQTLSNILKKEKIKMYLLVSDGFVSEKIKDIRRIEKTICEKLKRELPNLKLKFSCEELKINR